MRTRQRTRFSSSLALVTLLGTACGPDYLTPDDVRTHLLLPSGAVTEDTIGRATDDFFGAQDADGIEGYANFLKSSESGDSGASAYASGLLESEGNLEAALAAGVAEDVGDIFCAASLVAAIASFDDCDESDTECEVELVIDSCILRIGDGADENARGRIVFNLSTQRSEGWSREALSLSFEAFETSNADGNMDYLGGLITIEATEIGDGYEEVIFAADVDTQERSLDRGLLDDGIIWRHRVTAAMRFLHQEGVDRESGSLEIVAFVDDTDDTRDESVVIQLEAESRRVDENTELAGATLIVRGSNGAFTCTWEAASREGDGGDSSYESAGACIDEETGEEFTWSASATSSS
jgi:hypothetical protein